MEAALKAMMLIDLRRRPADEIRGPKWLWAVSALVNTAGLGSIAYFLLGRRPPLQGVEQEHAPVL